MQGVASGHCGIWDGGGVRAQEQAQELQSRGEVRLVKKPGSLQQVTLWQSGGSCGVALAPRGRTEGVLESSYSALDPIGHSHQRGLGPPLCPRPGFPVCAARYSEGAP